MENDTPNKEMDFTEKLIELIGLEEVARNVLALSVAIGDNEMETSARETLQRASDQIAAMGAARYDASVSAAARPSQA